MPYDPDDLYTAEPKLLSLSCFPTSFTPIAPPHYDLIMAGNTRYNRVSEDSRDRVSFESSVGNEDLDAGLLLLDPMRNGDGDSPPLSKHKFTTHPTAITRLLSVCLFIPSFVMLIVSHRPRSLSALIIIAFAIARNVALLLHHLLSKHIRIRLEFRNGRSNSKLSKGCPAWLKDGPFHLIIDLILVTVLLITGIIATQGAWGWASYYRSGSQLAVPGAILSHVANFFYFISICDLGNPSNITITGGISFNFGKDKKPDRPQPQMYHDVETQAAGGLAVGSGMAKTGADSPVII